MSPGPPTLPRQGSLRWSFTWAFEGIVFVLRTQRNMQTLPDHLVREPRLVVERDEFDDRRTAAAGVDARAIRRVIGGTQSKRRQAGAQCIGRRIADGDGDVAHAEIDGGDFRNVVLKHGEVGPVEIDLEAMDEKLTMD